MSKHSSHGGGCTRVDDMSRREVLRNATIAGAAALVGTAALAQTPAASRPSTGAATAGHIGLLYPQQNRHRNVLDLSGLWQFQLDPKAEGETQEWFKTLPAPRPIAVPCSWNDLFDDAKNYLDLAWYRREIHVPSGWRGQTILLRVGSANYAAKVWVNGTVVGEHLGRQLPFV